MKEPFSSDRIFIRNFTDIVLANLSKENLGEIDFVNESGMSFYRLNRRLHSINEETKNQYIREIRIKKALEMLRNGSSAVFEIANKEGFGSHGYFNERFSAFFGFPPGETKKRESINLDHNVLTNSSTENASNKPSQSLYSYILQHLSFSMDIPQIRRKKM